MRKMFGFTPVESRLAEHLMRGLELRECAEQMRVSFETARFHMKRLLAKTQTRKQADLIRLIVSLPGTHQSLRSNAYPSPQTKRASHRDDFVYVRNKERC